MLKLLYVQVEHFRQSPRWMRLLTRAGKDLTRPAFKWRAPGSVFRTEVPDGRFGRHALPQLASAGAPGKVTGFPWFVRRQEFPGYGGRQESTRLAAHRPGYDAHDGERLQAIRRQRDLMARSGTLRDGFSGPAEIPGTGVSDKYSTSGYWRLALECQRHHQFHTTARPNIPSTEMQKVRVRVGEYGRATVVAMPDNKALLKNIPSGSGFRPLKAVEEG